MTQRFSIRSTALVDLDDTSFRCCGGVELHFGGCDGDAITVTATGTPESIHALADQIRAQHAAAV